MCGQVLIDAGADAYHVAHSSGHNPLLVACSVSDAAAGAACVRLLTEECYVDVNVQNDKGEGEHALLLAAEGGRVEVVKALIEAGAKVDRTDDRGRSALWLTAR